ncbi:MAG: hypothetical protein IH586_19770, partial [Anaerolineaceae bacterium]|nr:hypothetical protein [Anaerolineaceae bacterium]
MLFPAPRKWIIQLSSLFIILSIISGCSNFPIQPTKPPDPAPERTVVYPAAAVAAPALQLTATSTSTPERQSPRLFLPTYLPQRFRDEFHPPAQVEETNDEKTANLRLEIPSASPNSTGKLATHWIYALAAAFPTTLDNVSSSGLEKAWKGESGGELGKAPLLVDSDTYQVLSRWLGPANPGRVRIVPTADLLDSAWKEQPSWAIIPFEAIQPRWKVLRINGQSPLDNTFQVAEYPLAVRIELWVDEGVQNAQALSLPTNRDPLKLTTLV